MIGIWFRLNPYYRSKFALVDREVYEEVKDLKWLYFSTGYAQRWIYLEGKRTSEGLHQHILFLSTGKYYAEIDHKNGDSLDCRKENIRPCTRSQNTANQPKREGSKNKYKGVSIEQMGILCRIIVNGRRIYIGSYKTEEEAAIAYNQAAIQYFGEFARLNIIGKDNNEAEGMRG